ncbi:09040454-ca39-4365-9e36-9114e5e0bcab [Sclerotinia trifoliorum]|uniref:09040454-ca39-4365-9e36-9114e5e0bcab n=1 Tax=Sclerotinia trifoliorum TaxID=28548 RepID=A0A8H2ZY36_9HELO|nr:09040454-ca39-4365-9e36-9114e5e0bcab [Sclerotinia trifoliorum]
MANKIIIQQDGDLTLVLPPVSETSKIPYLCAVEKGKMNHIVVSSKIMMEASPVFKAMLDGRFQEGEILQRTGRVEVLLDDENPTAMNMLINLIYGHCLGEYNAIPLDIDLQTFTELAIVFDKYQIYLNDTFKAIAQEWRNKMLSPDTVFDGDNFVAENASVILPWISIAWVFKIDDIFSKYSKLLIKYCTPESIQKMVEAFEEMNVFLPIPDSLYIKIDEVRQIEIGICFDNVIKLIIQHDEYAPTRCHCVAEEKENCITIGRRALFRSAQRIGLWPLPKVPYEGYDVYTIKKTCEKLQILTCRHPVDRIVSLMICVEPVGIRLLNMEAPFMEDAELSKDLIPNPGDVLEGLFSPSYITSVGNRSREWVDCLAYKVVRRQVFLYGL